MITSPSPAQKPPEQSDQEQKKVIRGTLAKRRAGQTPLALFVKAVLRPLFKGLYYLLQAIRRHKLITLLVIVLLFVSSSLVSYFETGQAPFGIGYDQFNFHIHGTNGGGDQVRNWLYALRDDDATTLSFLDRFISSPPDPNQLTSDFSEKAAHLTWKNITVVGVSQETDTTIDSLVEVDLGTNGPGGSVSGYLLVHFVTVAQNDGIILGVDVLPVRPSQS
jgi:hypothetical protein